jgi:hypothetical protein
MQSPTNVRHGWLPGNVDELARAYRNAAPFPHAVLDDFLPAEVAEAALAAFPDLADPV